MIETLMFFALGFLAANLLTLAVIPFVHKRAERLTVRRLEASIPISIREVHACKDILRAEFAMSIRRLESTIDQLRSKLMTYVRALSKKSIANHRLKSLLDTRIAEAGVRSSRLSSDVSSLGTLQHDEDILVDKDTAITKLNMELDERSRAVDAQRIEIVALKIQVDALKRQIADAKHPIKARGDLPRRRTILRLAG